LQASQFRDPVERIRARAQPLFSKPDQHAGQVVGSGPRGLVRIVFAVPLKNGLEDRGLKKRIERRDRCGIGTCLDGRRKSEFDQYLVLRHRGRSEPLLVTVLRKPIATRRRDAEFEFRLHPLRVSAQ
jgi:hypothetical protein